MGLDAQQEIRRLFDLMTATINCPQMGVEAQRAAIRDFSDQLITQVRLPLLPTLEAPKPIFDSNGTMWL